MDQSSQVCAWWKHSKRAASRVYIVWYKHGQEPIRLHKLSQVFKNIEYRQLLYWGLFDVHKHSVFVSKNVDTQSDLKPDKFPSTFEVFSYNSV